MNTLIVGGGQIGTALQLVLETQYPTTVIDKFKFSFTEPDKFYDIMHVCFPYGDDFEDEVRRYQLQYKPKYTVIHSTVPPGTSKKLGAIFSPVTGIHPHLKQSLKTFVKHLAGEKASEVADYFRRVGMKVYLFDKAETAELIKVLDTTFYGLCVEFTKEVKRLTKEYDVPFEAWTIATDHYNEGYLKLGHPEYTRPNLVPIMQPIGGHCVLPNYNLLPSSFTKFLKEQYKKD